MDNNEKIDSIETEKELYENYYMSIYNNGFLVPDLKLTIPIYRYRGNIDYAIDEIEKSYIYLSDLDDLNDPFDSSRKVNFEESMKMKSIVGYLWCCCGYLKNKRWYNEIDQLINQNDFCKEQIVTHDFFVFLSNEIKKCGGSISVDILENVYYKSCDTYINRGSYGKVACFSEVCDSVTMWSYYADSHKGLCLKYEPCKLDISELYNRHLVDSIRKVWYSDIRFEDPNGEYTPFVKATEWSNEREWRLFRKTGKERISFPCLTEVYIGINFDMSYFSRLIDAIKMCKQEVQLFLMEPNQKDYSLKKSKINI